MTTELEIELLKKQFWKEVSELLRVGNFKGAGLISFTRSRIQQTRVQGWEEKDLLIEACIRSVEYIENNCREIQNPASFLRQVIINILREEVRKNIKNEKMILDINVKELDEEDISDEDEHQRALEHLNASLNKLSSKDRELIELRFVKKLSYEDIQKYFVAQGKDVPNLDALRQQMSRALKRLRQEFKGISDKTIC
jgi:DNA-directed RNA polymerase specialized sigma24 family protein